MSNPTNTDVVDVSDTESQDVRETATLEDVQSLQALLRLAAITSDDLGSTDASADAD